MAKKPDSLKDMPCNKPRKSWREGKKKAVKACEGGKEKIIHYGDSSMSDYTQHRSKKRRKNFHARHKCSEKKSKLSAGYWACKDLW
jgi:hypothetical protein